MSTSGSCSLVIRSHELNFEEIEANLMITPTRIIRKGQLLSKVIAQSEFDVWVFEIKYMDEKTSNQVLEELLSILNPLKIYLQSLSESADVRIKYYVQSEYAQMNFELYPNLINKLASMGIKLEISILSWGELRS